LKGLIFCLKVNHESQQLLTHLEEGVMVQRIENYNDHGISLCSRHVLQIFYKILKARRRVAEIGKYWVNHFVCRYQDIQSKVGKNIDKQRALATDIAILQKPLEGFYILKSQYHVLSENVWNTHEKGLAMGLGGGGTVLSRTERQNPKIMQDGKRYSNINYEVSYDALFTYSKAG